MLHSSEYISYINLLRQFISLSLPSKKRIDEIKVVTQDIAAVKLKFGEVKSLEKLILFL